MERPSLWLGFALQILVVRWSGCQADVDLTCEYGAALCIDHDFAYMVSVRFAANKESPDVKFEPSGAPVKAETYFQVRVLSLLRQRRGLIVKHMAFCKVPAHVFEEFSQHIFVQPIMFAMPPCITVGGQSLSRLCFQCQMANHARGHNGPCG